MAAGLMDPGILPVATESLGKVFARDIPRQLHSKPAQNGSRSPPLRFMLRTTLRPGQGEDELVQVGAGQRKTPPLLQ